MTTTATARTAPAAPPPTTSEPPSTSVGRARRRLTSRTASLVAVIIAVMWTIPTFGLFVSSFRPANDLRQSGWWTLFGPEGGGSWFAVWDWKLFQNPGFSLANYQDVLIEGELGSYFINSIVITVPSVLFPVAFAAMAAYALSWTSFRGRDWIFIGVFALQIVPLQMALVPLLTFFSRGLSVGDLTLELPFGSLGYNDDTAGFTRVWIAHTMFALPLSVFLLHNFMSELPRDLFEAARVDGASHPKIFRRIVLPLIVPALASLAIFQFLWVWNDLLVALIFSGGTEETAPITQRLAAMAGTRGGEWQRLTAGAFVAIVVPLIVFLSLQRYFVRGLLAGSVKG
jgi:alpha-glucoside transport system permease protein